MGGFSRGERQQLNDLLKGASSRQRKARKRALDQALLAALRQKAIEVAPWAGGTVPLTKLEMAVHRHWQGLSQEHRRLLTDALARSGFPEKESGEAALLDYCIAELKKSGRGVSEVSEAAMKLVEDILKEGGIGGNHTVYELVIEKIDTGSWQEQGLLKMLGYKVGRDGLRVNQRRRILRDAYRVSLVPGSDAVVEYLRSWGDPLSQQRLSMITGSIRRFMGLAQNKNADYSAALADWQADLDWLGG